MINKILITKANLVENQIERRRHRRGAYLLEQPSCDGWAPGHRRAAGRRQGISRLI